VYFTQQQPGILQSAPKLEKFKGLNSLHSLHCSLKPGDRIEAAAGISDIIGYAYLISDDLTQLESDYAQFKQIEREFFREMIC